MKKNLTLETSTDNFISEKDGQKSAEKRQEDDDDDDEFGRDEDSKPMTKDQLESESSNSVGSLQRIGDGEPSDGSQENIMHKTLSSSKLQGLFDQEDSGKF
jgi:hypothetical protein